MLDGGPDGEQVGWMEGQTDRRTEQWKDGRMEGWMYGNSSLCPTGYWPFGAAAQKVDPSSSILTKLVFVSTSNGGVGQWYPMPCLE